MASAACADGEPEAGFVLNKVADGKEARAAGQDVLVAASPMPSEK
jgi:hypothetical protein